VGQIGALIGIIVSLTLLEKLEEGVEHARFEARQSTGNPPPSTVRQPEMTGPIVVEKTAPTKARTKAREDRMRAAARQISERWPRWLFRLFKVLEWFGILLYLCQIPITYAMARLDYELRWYIVTDRSLRIRAGLAAVQETTMSFANVQQVAVSQGPLQRLLGIADLRVQSAGGGGDHPERSGGESLHTGIFHGVDNANEIRDLIQDRLRAFRQAGLGDPDDAHVGEHASPAPSPFEPAPNPALIGARELLQEARALRQALR